MIAFLQSAMRTQAPRLVFLGMDGLPAGGPAHGQVHQWLADNSDDWAVLRPSAFMQNFAEGSHLATIRGEDAIYSNTGDGRVPFISADDIARAAFAVLTGPPGVNRDFVITGEEAMSYDQVAERIGRTYGRPIHALSEFLRRGADRALSRARPAGGHGAVPGRRIPGHRRLRLLRRRRRRPSRP